MGGTVLDQAAFEWQIVDQPCLTTDDLRLLGLLASGMTTEAAARQFGLSTRTVRRRIRTLCDRVGVNTPIEAVVWAVRRRLI